eukprot:TRINITY_DN64811_c0_g1_i1.p1 TRINITY_DN64811_c0_g1~~TRINITY_DN64811_c0_g1_i1.p1  ORF type:complete len:271 (-),score=77.95 TRINITY_DN64811_c0_g1_i1:107-919(-)
MIGLLRPWRVAATCLADLPALRPPLRLLPVSLRALRDGGAPAAAVSRRRLGTADKADNRNGGLSSQEAACVDLKLGNGQVVKKGDIVEAKAGKRFHQFGALYFDEGWRGVVSDVFEAAPGDAGAVEGQILVQITWRTSSLVTHFTGEDAEETFVVISEETTEEDCVEKNHPYGKGKTGDDNDFVGLGPGSPTWDRTKVQYFVGDMVECRRDGVWTTARLAKNNADWSYMVKWDADAVEERVQYAELRKPRPAKVEATPLPGWLQDWWPLE